MLNKGKAIVLSTLKYKESDLIVRCYTDLRGAVSYLQKGVLKSKRGKTKSVYFQPLMLLEIEENFQPSRSLQYLKEVKCYFPYRSLHTNVFKASLSVFIAEILGNVLQEEEPNPQLYRFLEVAFQFLDAQERFSNFHLIFLMELTKYLGFYPSHYSETKAYFNLESGTFENQKSSLYLLEGYQRDLIIRLLNSDFETANDIKLNSQQRSEFLNTILMYFELHLGNFKKPKSLQVFSDVFN
ncbi:MAG: DNA repair protein RecO [Bacteroidota bacterium]